MDMSIFEFDWNMQDLAVVDVLHSVVNKTFAEGVEDIDKTVKGIDIEIDSILIPLQQISKELEQVSENVNADLAKWQNALDAKKAEFLREEGNFANFEEALANANELVNEDLQALTIASARQTNKGRL